MVPRHEDRGGVDGDGTELDVGLDEEPVATEAGVALAAVGVEDPEGRPPARRAGSVAGDVHLRPLADDVASEVDPRPPRQLEPQPGRLRNGRREPAGKIRWLQDDDAHAGPPTQRREAAQPVTEPVGEATGSPARTGPCRQVDDEQVHGPASEQRTGDGQPLVEVGRADDDEPLRPDAAGDGLDRVERAGEVQPGHDRTVRLGLGDMPQRQRRAAARRVPPECGERAARNAALAEDRVERGEARRVHSPDLAFDRLATRQPARLATRQPARQSARQSARLCLPGRLHRQRRDRQRPNDLGRRSRRGPTPARAKVGKRGGHGRCRHRHCSQIRTNVLSIQESSAGPRAFSCKYDGPSY